MPKRQYTLQYKSIVSGWVNILSAQQLTSRQYVIGFAKGMRQSNPCSELRMIDHQTGEVLEYWAKKSSVTTPNTRSIELGVEGERPYFKIGVQTFFIDMENGEGVEWWCVDMMKNAFEKLGCKIEVNERSKN